MRSADVTEDDLEARLRAKALPRDPESSPVIRRIQLASIVRDQRLMMRVGLDEKAVDEYTEKYRREREGKMLPGEKPFPLGTVFEIEPNHHLLAHAWHRFEGMLKAEITEWDFEVRQGTLADAAKFAARANNEASSVRYTHEDKRNACKKLFAVLGNVTARVVGEHAGVDHKTAEKCRPAEYKGQLREGKDGKTYRGSPAPSPIGSRVGEIPQQEDAAVTKLRQAVVADPLLRGIIGSFLDKTHPFASIDAAMLVSNIPELAKRDVLHAFPTMGAVRAAAAQIASAKPAAKPARGTPKPKVTSVPVPIGRGTAVAAQLGKRFVFVRILTVNSGTAIVEVSDGPPQFPEATRGSGDPQGAKPAQPGRSADEAASEPSDSSGDSSHPSRTTASPSTCGAREADAHAQDGDKPAAPKTIAPPQRRSVDVRSLPVESAADTVVKALAGLIDGNLNAHVATLPDEARPHDLFPGGSDLYWTLLRGGANAADKVLAPLGFKPHDGKHAAEGDLVIAAYGSRSRLIHAAFGWCAQAGSLPTEVFSPVQVDRARRRLVRHHLGEQTCCWVRRSPREPAPEGD